MAQDEVGFCIKEVEVDAAVAITIVGDAFADLLCYLDPSDPLPKPGGDARLIEPIRVVAGGSGLNTATHLRAIVRDFGVWNNSDVGAAAAASSIVDTRGNTENEKTEMKPSGSNTCLEVELQTVLNESDFHGKILMEHAASHGVCLVNRLPPSSTAGTGHCAVMVSRGERSFLTHRGCVEEFDASLIDRERIVDSALTLKGGERTKRHHRHIHIAGYYNLPGFWDGELSAVLLSVLEGRKGVGAGFSATTTVSLVPQHDATEEWDGGILEVLPLVDFLILSELEAQSIFLHHQDAKDTCDGANDENSKGSLDQMAHFFHSVSPSTWVIITLGPKGAVALFDERIILSRDAPIAVSNPIDPTGAGDAFAAGFLYGSLQYFCRGDTLLEGSTVLKGEGRCIDGVKEGLRWGTAIGTACVNRPGASTPAPKEEINALLNKVGGESFSPST